MLSLSLSRKARPQSRNDFLNDPFQNTVRGAGRPGEHGLSYWLETGTHRVLFDTRLTLPSQTRLLDNGAKAFVGKLALGGHHKKLVEDSRGER